MKNSDVAKLHARLVTKLSKKVTKQSILVGSFSVCGIKSIINIFVLDSPPSLPPTTIRLPTSVIYMYTDQCGVAVSHIFVRYTYYLKNWKP